MTLQSLRSISSIKPGSQYDTGAYIASRASGYAQLEPGSNRVFLTLLALRKLQRHIMNHDTAENSNY